MLTLNEVIYNNITVLTTLQIAEMYGTTNIINSNFKMNKTKYLNGKHYILLTGNDLKCF